MSSAGYASPTTEGFERKEMLLTRKIAITGVRILVGVELVYDSISKGIRREQLHDVELHSTEHKLLTEVTCSIDVG